MARPRTDDPAARARILEAAETLFAARGFSGAAVRDIASAAGVNPAMIHYYFGNKESLYRAILESAAARVRSLLMETAASDSTRERLTRFVDSYAAYILSHPNLARILFREMLTGGKRIKVIAQKYAPVNYGLAREAIADGIRRKELRAIDVDLAPISLMGMIVVFQFFRPIISVALGKSDYDEQFIKRISAHTIDLFLKGAERGAASSGKAAARKGAKRQTKVKR
ncbi:MAG: CerR family C-terminal domain-containing protein [Acidobacteriota bacterium]